MDVAEIPIGSAAGAILPTTLTLDTPYKKGTRLSEDDIARPYPAADEVVAEEAAHRVGQSYWQRDCLRVWHRRASY